MEPRRQTDYRKVRSIEVLVHYSQTRVRQRATLPPLVGQWRLARISQHLRPKVGAAVVVVAEPVQVPSKYVTRRSKAHVGIPMRISSSCPARKLEGTG